MKTEGRSASGSINGTPASEFTPEDLAKIFHYPSIGQLFSETAPETAGDFAARLTSTRDQLETVVRRGDRAEADRAGTAIKGINVTLDFLESLQRGRAGER